MEHLLKLSATVDTMRCESNETAKCMNEAIAKSSALLKMSDVDVWHAVKSKLDVLVSEKLTAAAFLVKADKIFIDEIDLRRKYLDETLLNGKKDNENGDLMLIDVSLNRLLSLGYSF